MKPILTCLIGKQWSGKWEARNILEEVYTQSSIGIGDIIRNYCQQNNIPPTREHTTSLWNTVFDGETLAHHIYQQLPQWGILDGLRKPETLEYLQQYYQCQLIGIVAPDTLRRQRVLARKRPWDAQDFSTFIAQERAENSFPNKQNIELLLAWCDMFVHNISSLDYFKQQLIAVMQSTPPDHANRIDTQGYQRFTRAIISNERDEICLLYDKNKGYLTLPWGKIDPGELPASALQRELWEELGGNIETPLVYQGYLKGTYPDGPNKWYFFATHSHGNLTTNEPQNHEIRWVPRTQIALLSYKDFINTALYHRSTKQRITDYDGEITTQHHQSLSIQRYNDTIPLRVDI